MKDSTVRIESVLDFIKTTSVVTPSVRTAAYQVAQSFIATKYPKKNEGQPAYEEFSKGMSLGFHFAKDPDGLRNMKRGSYLLGMAIRDAKWQGFPVPPLSTIIEPQVFFGNLLRKAATLQDPAAANLAALTYLKEWPLKFLEYNLLTVHGSTSRDLNIDTNVVPYRFYYDVMSDCYLFSKSSQVAGATDVEVDSVVAQHYSDVPGGRNAGKLGAFGQIQGIKLTKDIMVTTQFTGCAFCMKSHGGTVYCAHITPHDPSKGVSTTGQELALATIQSGDFSNARGGVFAVYGTERSANVDPKVGTGGYPGSKCRMTIIGVKAGGSYSIYCQVNGIDGNRAKLGKSSKIFS